MDNHTPDSASRNLLDGKRCSKCGLWKCYEEFHVRSSNADGRRKECKACRVSGSRKYNETHQTAHRDRSRIYREQHIEEVRARDREYGRKNREKLTVYHKRWRSENREYLKQYRVAYLDKNRDHKRATDRAYAAANSAKAVARVRAWKQANPERSKLLGRVHRANRRAMEVLGNITRADWLRMLEAADGKCLCCGANSDLHMDHVIPLSKGGPHMPGNAQVLCRRCNQRKGTKRTDYRNAGTWPWTFISEV